MIMEDVKPLNYCRDAIKDLTELERKFSVAAPFSAYAVRNIIRMLKDSVKFILPNCAEFIAPDELRQTHLDLARLPYPVVAFEAPWVKPGPIAQDPLHPIEVSSKRIALCWEIRSDFEPVPGCNRQAFLDLPEGGVFVCSIYWLDAEQRWTLSFGGAFYPYNNTLQKAASMDGLPEGSKLAYESLLRAGRVKKSGKRFDCEPFAVLHEVAVAAEAKLGGRDALNAEILINIGDELSAFINACSILNCANIIVEELPAGAAHLKKFVRGKRVEAPARKEQAAYSYKILQIAEERTRTAEGGAAPATTGIPKRMHLRRGHIRRLEERTIWVRPAVINAGSGSGVVDKDYRLVKSDKVQ